MHTVDYYYSAIQSNKLLKPATVGMNLKGFMVSKRSQTKKVKNSILGDFIMEKTKL